MDLKDMKPLKCFSQLPHTPPHSVIVWEFTWNKGTFVRLKCWDGSNGEGALAPLSAIIYKLVACVNFLPVYKRPEVRGRRRSTTNHEANRALKALCHGHTIRWASSHRKGPRSASVVAHPDGWHFLTVGLRKHCADTASAKSAQTRRLPQNSIPNDSTREFASNQFILFPISSNLAAPHLSDSV